LFFFSNQGGSSFDFGELERAIALQAGVKIGHDETKPPRKLLSFLSLSILFLTFEMLNQLPPQLQN